VRQILIFNLSGSEVHLVEDKGTWSILVCTEIMRRVHNEQFAKETLFVDTTSHLDVTNCSFTALATSTKAGAVPLGILLHAQQTTKNYQQAFELFQSKYSNAFGGENVNINFVVI
jgi:hypothetical protein